MSANEAAHGNLALGDVGGACSSSRSSRCTRTPAREPAELYGGRPAPQGAAVDEAYADVLRAEGVPVETGVFGAHMLVELVNDVLVTILVEA